MKYSAFLQRRAQEVSSDGFDPVWMPDFLFDFQQSGTEWSIRKGKSALFRTVAWANRSWNWFGLKTFCEKTTAPLPTPLAVAKQIVREGEKFGIEVSTNIRRQSFTESPVRHELRKTSQIRSGAMGSLRMRRILLASRRWRGKRRADVTEFLRTLPYRLLATG